MAINIRHALHRPWSHGESQLEFCDGFVRKTLCGVHKKAVLDPIYSAIKSMHSVIKLVDAFTIHETSSDTVLHLEPICEASRIPCDEDTLADTIFQLLTILRSLHERGILHRDCRWPNFLPTDLIGTGYVLIDFESACFASDPYAFSPNAGPPEIKTGLGWIYQSDMFLVGSMIKKFTGSLSEEGRDFMNRLLQEDPSLRPLPATALVDPWLSKAASRRQFASETKRVDKKGGKKPMKKRRKKVGRKRKDAPGVAQDVGISGGT
jgi:hypothetical protein